ncbi:MAG: hypothetical protein H0W97_04455 [Actinobacteria bacterium]|nr:hypothetical protein [Actinomycetota bacterium]
MLRDRMLLTPGVLRVIGGGGTGFERLSRGLATWTASQVVIGTEAIRPRLLTRVRTISVASIEDGGNDEEEKHEERREQSHQRARALPPAERHHGNANRPARASRGDRRSGSTR